MNSFAHTLQYGVCVTRLHNFLAGGGGSMYSLKLYDLNYKQFSQGVSPSFHVILKGIQKKITTIVQGKSWVGFFGFLGFFFATRN